MLFLGSASLGVHSESVYSAVSRSQSCLPGTEWIWWGAMHR